MTSSKLKRLWKHIAKGIAKFEHPFHLAYLGAGSHYYYEHGVMIVSAAAGGSFVVVLFIYLIEIFEVLSGE